MGNVIRTRLPSGSLWRWEFEKRGEEVAVDVAGPLTLDNHDLMLQAALKGTGLAYLSEWGLSNELVSGRLIRVLEDWTPPYSGLCVYYPGHRHVPAGLQAFIAVVRELTAPR